MKEKKNSAVNVEDVEADAMESMLHFIYTGERYSSFHSGPLLLDLSQFQSSEVLKIGICSGKLDFMEFASMELASHLLAAADKYALPRLKVLRYMHNVSMLCRALSDSV